MKPRTFGLESIPNKEQVGYKADPISTEASAEGTMWAKILEVLMKGPSKPNSPVFELAKVDKAIRKARDNNWDTIQLERLRDSIVNCCPTQSTVNDSLVFKDQRVAVLKRIADITGIRDYMTNGKAFEDTGGYSNKDSRDR